MTETLNLSDDKSDALKLVHEFDESGMPVALFLDDSEYQEVDHKFDMARINRISQTFRKLDLETSDVFKSDGIVRCMDGGTEGGLRMAGSGILLPRAKLALPQNHPMADFFRSFGIELTGESEKVLLPDDDHLNILRDKVQQGIIKGISAHAECGAAKGDLINIFQALNVPEDVISSMLKDPKWDSVVDAHARLFSETLAQELGTSYSWIPLEEMSRESHHGKGHDEEAFYVDLIGGTRPGVAFNSAKLKGEVPNGFTIHPALSDWKNIFHRINISLTIAKVATRFTPENPFVVFLIDDPKKSRITREIIQGIREATKGFGDRVVIKQVAPSSKN